MTRVPLFLILSLSLVTAAASFAQAITDADKAAIQTRIDAFNATMRAGDMASTFDFISPAVLARMASQFGVDEATLRKSVADQITEMMKTVTIDEFGMDLARATFATTPDGSRGYALIPTTSVMTVDGSGRMKATSQTLALLERGQWYLMRIDDASQVGFLRAAYPEFEGVTFPAGTLTAVE